MANDDLTKNELAQTFLEKGYQLQMSGYLNRAAHFYRRSIQYKATARAHNYLGWVYSLKGEPDKAISECEKAIAIDPTLGNSYNDIGAYLMQKKNYNEAILWLQKALRAPNYENYCYPNLNLGRIFEKQGNWQKAHYYYRKAVEENPSYDPARIALEKLQGKFN